MTELLEKINGIEPDIIAEADSCQKPKRKLASRMGWIKWAAAAAVLVFVLGGVTAYAVGSKYSFGKIVRYGERGFSATIEIEKTDFSEFKGNIRNAPQRIVQQVEDYVPQPSWSSLYIDPCVYLKTFDSLEKAVDYLGFDGAVVPYLPYSDSEFTNKPFVIVHGDKEGRVDEVTVSAEHIDGNSIGMQFEMIILTNNFEGSVYRSGGVWTLEFPRTMTYETGTNASGSEYGIVFAHNNYNEYCFTACYLVKGSVLYHLHLTHADSQQETINGIVRQWADSIG